MMVSFLHAQFKARTPGVETGDFSWAVGSGLIKQLQLLSEEFYFNLEEAVSEHSGVLPLLKPSFPLKHPLPAVSRVIKGSS